MKIRNELNKKEMEQVSGGGAVHMCAKKKLTDKICDWIWSWFN